MNNLPFSETVLSNVAVPKSLVAKPGQFGGKDDGECLWGDLLIRDEYAFGMRMTTGEHEKRRIVLPKLTEPHVHLDKCHTAARLDNIGGDLHAAILAQRKDKQNWSEGDIRARAERGLNELVNAGCKTVRSHVDWSSGIDARIPPPAWHVLQELAQDKKEQVSLQLAPLVDIADLAVPETAATIAKTVARDGGALGSFVFDQPERKAGIKSAFQVAEKYGLALDFHVDEGLAEGLNGLSMIADVAIETGFQGPILCGHASSLMNVHDTTLKKLLERIAQSGLAVASLPTTNLYLQGRTTGTPDRRGVTRINELMAADVPVAIGTDNVSDAFCPLGRHDPVFTLSMAVLAAHLDPPLGDYIPLITTNAEIALGLPPTYIDGASINDLLVFEINSLSDLLGGISQPLNVAGILQGEHA